MNIRLNSIYVMCLVLTSCVGAGAVIQKYEPLEEGTQRAYFAAQNHLIKGDLDLAYSSLQACAQAEPEMASFQFELGKIDYELGRFDDAYANLYRAVTLDPENDWYSYYKGLSLIALESYDDAWGDIAYWVTQRPSDIGALIESAQLFLEADQPLHATKLLFYYENEIAKNIDVRLMEFSLMVGYVLSDLDGLNEFLDDAIEDFPDVAEFHYEQALLSFFKKDYPLAISQLKQVLIDFPEFEKTNLSLGECLWANGDYSEAFIFLGKAFKSYEIDAEAKLALLLEIQKAEFEGLVAISDFEPLVVSAVNRHPDNAELMYYAAMFFADAKQFEKAESTLKSVIKMAPDKRGAHLNLIDLYYQSKQKDKALYVAENAIEIFPLEPRFFLYAAEIYKNKKDYNTAIKRLKTGVAVLVEAPELEAVFYSELGYCLREVGEKEKSYKMFEKSLTKVEDPLVMNNHAFFLAKDGVLLEQAYKWSVLSNELIPNDPHFLDTLAFVLYLRGEYEDALHAIQKAQNLILPQSDEVYNRREAKILKALGR